MATFTKLKLSGSTDGKAIKVVQTATAGTTIHTAHATALDEIWLYAHNSSSGTVKLTLEFGGTGAPDDHIEINIGMEGTGLVLVSPGLLLTNSLVVKAFAATANVVTITGYVNRIA
jgi:hypothetical protein